MSPEAYRYRAFVSYSHRDKLAATWLHRTLEIYRLPPKVVGRETRFGPVPRRLTPIFRDRDELSASADLGSVVTAALEASLFLIVVCSPAAVASRWVDEEIRVFKRLHGEGRVLALIVAGEPYASASPVTAENECFPRSLRFKMGADGHLSRKAAEPIAADLRAGNDGRRLAKLKLVAGLTGLALDDLVHRETQRKIRRLGMLATGSLVCMILAGGLALYANARRIEANQQRQIAERESATARATSDYLVETFTISNPATENPRTITAVTMLARSAARARTELADQPVIQARLIYTLAQAYNNLGLFEEARRMIERSSPAIKRAGVDGVGAQLTLASTYLGLGALDKATAAIDRAEATLGPDQKKLPEWRAMAAVTRGMIRIATQDTKGGVADFNRALAFYRASPESEPRKIAALLQNRALLLSDDGQFQAAEASLAQALSISRHNLGERHLFTGQIWFALAQNAFLAGKLPLAQIRIANALAIERLMLDQDNPIIADALSMQGQIFQGQKKLPEAKDALEQAIAIYRKAFRRPHYLIGIAEVYLALVESDRGHVHAALRILDDAKHNYDVSYGSIHPNHGDLLINRALILARAGRVTEARKDCAAGLHILADTLGPKASYTEVMGETCAKLPDR
jgi:tetratricopeptide (TPR) repeat protein